MLFDHGDISADSLNRLLMMKDVTHRSRHLFYALFTGLESKKGNTEEWMKGRKEGRKEGRKVGRKEGRKEGRKGGMNYGI